MNILVTGGAGFVGSHIVDRLVGLEHKVVVVDNLLTGNTGNISHISPSANLNFFKLDISNKDRVKSLFEDYKFDYVFHAAAGYLVQSLDNPIRDANTSIFGALNLIELASKYGTKKIIYSNSGGASYGEPKEIPMPETHPMNPTTPYGNSKLSAENYFKIFKEMNGLNFTSLRYANIYGPRQNPKLEGGVVSVFLDSLVQNKSPVMRSDGTPTRDYCYVDDVVDANIVAMEKGDGECYNVGTGTEVSVLELYRTMQKVLGTDVEFTKGTPWPGDIQRCSLDITKIQKELGWKPKTSLEQGIKKTADWLKEIHKK